MIRRVVGASMPPAERSTAVASRWFQFRVLLDRLVAVVFGVLTAPIVAVLAVLIRREDGGPPLIRVPRVGRDGRPFGMWKLRSMEFIGPDGLAAGASLTQGADDERITPIGRRLRSYHLDELPQLWNVARGEMTLIGPRPEAPEFVDLHDGRWADIVSVPPGIAGPTQLIVGDWEREVIASSTDNSGYRNAVLPTKLAIDLWYLRASSPATDFLVAGTLLRRFLPGNEAWTLRHRVFADVPQAAPAHAYLRAHQVARHETRNRGTRPPWTRVRERLAHELDARVARNTATDDSLGLQPLPERDVWSAQMDADVVLFDAAHGLAHHLSAEAAIVWHRCDGVATVRSIAEDLAPALAVAPEQMLRDVTTVVLQLVDCGVLVDARLPRPPMDGGNEPDVPLEAEGNVTETDPDRWLLRFSSSTFDALGLRFQVRAEDAVLGAAVAEVLAPLAVAGEPDHIWWLVGPDDRPDDAGGELAEHGEVGPTAAAKRLFCDGRQLHTFEPDEDPLSIVLWFISQHAVAATELLAIHAAAVERDGQVIGFPGGEGAGKSTVSAALVADGFGYITEEVLALDVRSGEVVPLPLPFRLKPGSQALFEELRPEPGSPSARLGGDVWFVDPERVRAGSRSPGGEVRTLVVPAYRPGAVGSIESLSSAGSLMKLLASCMNLDRIGHDGFVRLVELARTVPAYRVEYEGLADARRLVGEQPAQGGGVATQRSLHERRARSTCPPTSAPKPERAG